MKYEDAGTNLLKGNNSSLLATIGGSRNLNAAELRGGINCVTPPSHKETRRVDGNADILSHPVGNNILCLGVT